jgi:insertion element IS1 protein InsB
MNELWSIVGDTSRQYWLWWAIDHHTGEPLAFHFGTREYKNLGEFLSLLGLFGINSIYTEHTYAYLLGVTESEVVRGKESTQKVEREQVSLRGRSSGLERGHLFFQRAMYTQHHYRSCYYLLVFPKNYLVNNIFRPLPFFYSLYCMPILYYRYLFQLLKLIHYSVC